MLHVRSLELVLITEDLYLLMCIMEKAMATHSSILAWRIPGAGGAWWAAVYGVAQSLT